MQTLEQKIALLEQVVHGFHAVKNIRAWAAEENMELKHQALCLIKEIKDLAQ